jgi:hypothetical protein
MMISKGYLIIPEKSTAELIDEANKLFGKDKKTPETVPKPKPKPAINEVKKLSELLERAFDY